MLRNILPILCGSLRRLASESTKELTPMRKDNVDLANAVVWIPDSKTPNGIAEVPLTPLAVQAFQRQFAISGDGPFLFPSDLSPSGHHKNLRKA
jgi:integrase